MTNPTGPLYRRNTTGNEFSKAVRQYEETFNHIFDLAFGILDEEITNDIFCQLLGCNIKDALRSYGRELGAEFGHPKLYDIFQHDGFFSGEKWSLAIELKFDAKTSLDQLAKYLLAFSIEREMTTERKPVTLVYISPNPESLLRNTFPFTVDEIGSAKLEEIMAGAKPSVCEPLGRIPEIAASVLDDMTLQAFSWSEFDKALQTYSAGLAADVPANRTVTRLLQGLSDEIRSHLPSGCG